MLDVSQTTIHRVAMTLVQMEPVLVKDYHEIPEDYVILIVSGNPVDTIIAIPYKYTQDFEKLNAFSDALEACVREQEEIEMMALEAPFVMDEMELAIAPHTKRGVEFRSLCMAIYKTATYEYGEYLFQNFFNSQEKSFWVVIYKRNGNRVKKCEESLSENGAELNARKFLQQLREENAS